MISIFLKSPTLKLKGGLRTSSVLQSISPKLTTPHPLPDNFFGNRFTTKKVTAFQRPSEKWEIRLWNQNNMCFGAKNVQKHDFHCPIFNAELKHFYQKSFEIMFFHIIFNMLKIRILIFRANKYFLSSLNFEILKSK